MREETNYMKICEPREWQIQMCYVICLCVRGVTNVKIFDLEGSDKCEDVQA